MSPKVWWPSQYKWVLALLTLEILLRQHVEDHHGWKWIIWCVQRFLSGGNCPGHQRPLPSLCTREHGCTLRNVLARKAWKTSFLHASHPPLTVSARATTSTTCRCSELHPWLRTKKLNDASFYLQGCLISTGVFEHWALSDVTFPHPSLHLANRKPLVASFLEAAGITNTMSFLCSLLQRKPCSILVVVVVGRI